MADEDIGGSRPAAGDEIKPYRIHVSSKYLDLTRQKLEITRLPHEVGPQSKDWWEPKAQVEPLIDFWLEQYSWRTQEETLNEVPQFRTGISIPESETPIRVHFIHVRSTHAHAIPLLLIPPFPFTNLSLCHLIKLFTEPEDAENNQPFHLVIPSLPGLGFSDALPNNTSVISTVAEILNVLMTRLSYPFYLATNTGAASSSPAEIDWKLANYLATHYAASCLGMHFISPPLFAPKVQEAPWEWTKWSIASFFQAPILGYSQEDFSALERSGGVRKRTKDLTPEQFGLSKLGLREPNTLAYALCDSPTGLLVFVLKSLRVLGPKHEFSPTDIINLTELAWLPGPEAAMRFWAHCVFHSEKEEKKISIKPKVAISVFLGDDEVVEEGDIELQNIEPQPAPNAYSCPGWANARFDVVHASRVAGKPGLLAWERPEVIAQGVRGLAKQILAADQRLKQLPEPPTVPLQQVVVAQDSPAVVKDGRDKVTTPTVAGPSTQGEGSWRLEQIREGSETPKKQQQRDRGGTDIDFDGESPDTIVATPTGN